MSSKKVLIANKKRSANPSAAKPAASSSTYITKEQRNNDETDKLIDNYEEIPQESEQDAEKRRLKREYNKRKVKKQRQNKKGFEIVEESTDYVTPDGEETASIDMAHHLGIQHRTAGTKHIKKSGRLRKALMVDEDADVLVSLTSEELTAAEKQKQKELKELKKKQKLLNKDKNTKDKKSSKTDKEQKTSGQQQKTSAPQKSMLTNEISRQLSLLSDIADDVEYKVATKVVKEQAKQEYLENKDAQREESKSRKKKLRNLVLQQVAVQNKQQKMAKKSYTE